MISVHFHKLDEIPDAHLRYAVIASRYAGRWVFCRHRLRSSWEMPGGHREQEPILRTAERELFEETGALAFTLTPVCVYSVTMPANPLAALAGPADAGKTERSFGLLCFADIRDMGPLPGLEIEEVRLFDGLPAELTYPEIQPRLLGRVMDAGLF